MSSSRHAIRRQAGRQVIDARERRPRRAGQIRPPTRTRCVTRIRCPAASVGKNLPTSDRPFRSAGNRRAGSGHEFTPALVEFSNPSAIRRLDLVSSRGRSVDAGSGRELLSVVAAHGRPCDRLLARRQVGDGGSRHRRHTSNGKSPTHRPICGHRQLRSPDAPRSASTSSRSTRSVAPGSRCLVIATVSDAEGNPRRQKKIEWSLDGVGEIAAVDHRQLPDRPRTKAATRIRRQLHRRPGPNDSRRSRGRHHAATRSDVVHADVRSGRRRPAHDPLPGDCRRRGPRSLRHSPLGRRRLGCARVDPGPDRRNASAHHAGRPRAAIGSRPPITAFAIG